MTFANGFQTGMRFCSWSLRQGRPLPERITDTHRFDQFQLGFTAGIELAHLLAGLFSPSPTTQGCTPEGGVSADSTDDNSTGGVTAPEVTWRASGSHSVGGAHE